MDKLFFILNHVTKQLQRSSLDVFEAINAIKRLYKEITVFRNNYERLIKEAQDFIEKLNKMLASDEYILSLNIQPGKFQVDDQQSEFDIEFIKGVIDGVVVNILIELDSNFLNEFEHMMLYKEIAFLDLNYLEKNSEDDREEISLKRLCVLNDIKESEDTVLQLHNFHVEYSSFQKNLHNTSASSRCT